MRSCSLNIEVQNDRSWLNSQRFRHRNGNQNVRAIATSVFSVYAGGDFLNIHGPGDSPTQARRAVRGNTVFVGGDFSSMGGVRRSFFGAFNIDTRQVLE